MTSSNRGAIINKILKVLRKHYKPVVPQSERSVLDHLLYACCLENARYESADEAFAKVQQSYFDLNEVRVTTISELCEAIDVLPNPAAAATNLKRALQAVFEAHFDFDIEFLRKQNLGKSEKDLEKYTSGNKFLISYVVQHGLSGHSIPCGKSELMVLMLSGLITPVEMEKQVVPGLERAIPKNKGVEFASLLHQLAAEYEHSPNGSKVRAILLEIDPDAKDRFPKRVVKKEAVPEKPSKREAPPAPQSKKKSAPHPVAPVKDSKGDRRDSERRDAERRDAERREKSKKPIAKVSDSDSKKSAAKVAAKGLIKKKPR